jgi:hypothetical protein
LARTEEEKEEEAKAAKEVLKEVDVEHWRRLRKRLTLSTGGGGEGGLTLSCERG